MKNKSQIGRLLPRILLLTVVVIMAASMLTSCMNTAIVNATFKSNEEIITKDYKEDVNGLSSDDIKKVALLLEKNPKASGDQKDYIALESLVAAYRGYDMLAEDFDDKNLGDPITDESQKTEIAKKVLEKYNTGDNKVDVNFEKLNMADINLIIKALQIDVKTNSSRDLISSIMYWIGIALRGITKTVGFGNYIVGICIFAIVIEIVLLPFSIMQQKTSIKQARLKPKEVAIRKKYAGRNDKATQQKMNMEVQELYQKENANPLSGCLPMLIQLPIIMILYYIVIDPLRYVYGFSTETVSALSYFFTASNAAGGLGEAFSASRGGTIEILSLVKNYGINAFESLKDFAFFTESSRNACWSLMEGIKDIPSFNIGPINMGYVPSITRFDWLLLIPVLTFATQFGSMKLTKKLTFQPSAAQAADDKTMACQNNIMDITMPLMSVWISFMVPGVVGIYWMFKGIIGVLKTFILSRVMPLPKFTDEDYKAAEKEIAGKQEPKRIQKSENAGKVRSLHHIDDDDYDEQGNYIGDPTGESSKEEPVEESVPEDSQTEIPENNLTKGASLKDESDKKKNKKKKDK